MLVMYQKDAPYYFAYGPNLSLDIMHVYGKNAEPYGIAKIPKWHYGINKYGYLTVQRDASSMVYGMLWRLNTRKDLDSLSESVDIKNRGYEICVSPCITSDNHLHDAFLHVSQPSSEYDLWPGYIDHVINHAYSWGMPIEEIKKLRKIERG